MHSCQTTLRRHRHLVQTRIRPPATSACTWQWLRLVQYGDDPSGCARCAAASAAAACAGLLDPQGGPGLIANGDVGGGDLNNDSSIPLMHVPQSFLDMDLPLRSLTPEDELATAKLNDDLAKQSTAALAGAGGVRRPPPDPPPSP